MSTREAVGSIGNSNYWGLVQQKGPWKSVARDRANAKSSLSNKFFRGGGVQGGGTKNAGNGGWYSQMNPEPEYNKRGPPPKPTRYADRKVTYTREEFGYKQRVGKPAVGASYPTSGGQFPGSKPRTEQVFQSGASQIVAEKTTSQVLAPIDTDIPDIMMGSASTSPGSNPFSDSNEMSQSDRLANELRNALAADQSSRNTASTLGKRRGGPLENPRVKIREPKVDFEVKTPLTSMVEQKARRDRESAYEKSQKNLSSRLRKRYNPALPRGRYI